MSGILRVVLLGVCAGLALWAGKSHWFANFDSGGLEGWHLPIPEDWEIADLHGNRVLRLKKGGPIGSEPRRPIKFALWKQGCVSRFHLQVKLRRDAIRQQEADLLIAFGYQDKLHFYYAHLSSDDGDTSHHNGLFKVDGGDRVRIGGAGSSPALPDGEWHTVTLAHDPESGRIQLYLDGEQEPRWHAVDRAFRYGLVGIGSFNDTGVFDDFHLTGTRSEECR